MNKIFETEFPTSIGQDEDYLPVITSDKQDSWLREWKDHSQSEPLCSEKDCLEKDDLIGAAVVEARSGKVLCLPLCRDHFHDVVTNKISIQARKGARFVIYINSSGV